MHETDRAAALHGLDEQLVEHGADRRGVFKWLDRKRHTSAPRQGDHVNARGIGLVGKTRLGGRPKTEAVARGKRVALAALVDHETATLHPDKLADIGVRR